MKIKLDWRSIYSEIPVQRPRLYPAAESHAKKREKKKFTWSYGQKRAGQVTDPTTTTAGSGKSFLSRMETEMLAGLFFKAVRHY